MIDKFIEIHLSLVREASKISYKRYLFSKINWKNPLIGIVGQRGVGKTTLLLQYYLDNFKSPEDCLYISADNINVVNQGLYNIAEEFFKFGGKVLLIDEIHKYPQWQLELKNIYDSFTKKKIVFSGSSTLSILKGKGDLSRRVILYFLKGLSFREFLALRLNKNFKPLSSQDLFEDHIKRADDICAEIPVLRYFKEYLAFGYYPFFKEGTDTFYNRLNNILEKIFYEDLPSVFKIRPTTIYSLKKLFYLVAVSQPFIPNISRISSQLNISKEYIYFYIEQLQRAGLFNLLFSRQKGFKLLRKPQKIYLENPNLFFSVEEEKGFNVHIGSIRESFFINQASTAFRLFSDSNSDFITNKGINFEIGGKNKKNQKKISDYFLILDNINVGFKNHIPLWLFGFLY